MYNRLIRLYLIQWKWITDLRDHKQNSRFGYSALCGSRPPRGVLRVFWGQGFLSLCLCGSSRPWHVCFAFASVPLLLVVLCSIYVNDFLLWLRMILQWREKTTSQKVTKLGIVRQTIQSNIVVKLVLLTCTFHCETGTPRLSAEETHMWVRPTHPNVKTVL